MSSCYFFKQVLCFLLFLVYICFRRELGACTWGSQSYQSLLRWPQQLWMKTCTGSIYLVWEESFDIWNFAAKSARVLYTSWHLTRGKYATSYKVYPGRAKLHLRQHRYFWETVLFPFFSRFSLLATIPLFLSFFCLVSKYIFFIIYKLCYWEAMKNHPEITNWM